MKSFHPFPENKNQPYIIAHRGISGKAPENTMAAFSLAAAQPEIAMIELDVRITKDQHIVVLHDRVLQRTTTGNGVVYNYTLDELKKFDAGSWFHSRFSEETIPTLAEVFQLCKGKCWVNIELKGDYFYRNTERFLERVLETVQEQGMEESVLYSSFKHKLLNRIKALDPNAWTGVIYNFFKDFRRAPSLLAANAGASVFVCAKHELSKSMIQDLRTHAIALYVYTLNSADDIQKMLDVGVDGIMSDNADDVIHLLQNNRR